MVRTTLNYGRDVSGINNHRPGNLHNEKTTSIYPEKESTETRRKNQQLSQSEKTCTYSPGMPIIFGRYNRMGKQHGEPAMHNRCTHIYKKRRHFPPWKYWKILFYWTERNHWTGPQKPPGALGVDQSATVLGIYFRMHPFQYRS